MCVVHVSFHVTLFRLAIPCLEFVRDLDSHVSLKQCFQILHKSTYRFSRLARPMSRILIAMIFNRCETSVSAVCLLSCRVVQPVGPGAGATPAIQAHAALHGGARKGQMLELSAYTTKTKLQEWSLMSWNGRVLAAVRAMRQLGCEWPTEGCYKHAATLCMLWESCDSPSFGADQKSNAYVHFKSICRKTRDCEKFDDATDAQSVKAPLRWKSM